MFQIVFYGIFMKYCLMYIKKELMWEKDKE